MTSKEIFDPYNVRSTGIKEIRRERRRNHPPIQTMMSNRTNEYFIEEREQGVYTTFCTQ